MTYNSETFLGQTIGTLTGAGTLLGTDVDVVERAGVPLQTTLTARATLVRATPAASRTAALPATLTASDNDRNVLLTGTSGNLGQDGTLVDGFRCFILNNASGNATYSGITGLLGTTTLASGASTTVFKIGSTVYATAPANTSVSTATAYTTALSSASGVTGAPVTMTFTPTAGAWPASGVLTPTAGGTLAGTFSPTSITLVASSAPVTLTFTPSSASGTSGGLNSSVASPTMTNTTGSLTYSVVTATATAYTTSLSVSHAAVGVAVTATFTPTGGSWPGSEAITLTNVGLTGSWSGASGGTLSGSVLTPTAGGAACSANFTPTAASAGTINSTTSPSITNTSGGQSYTADAVATSFSTAPTSVTVASGAATTLTFTLAGGVAGPTQTFGLALVTVAGSFSNPVNGTVAGTGPYTFTPTTGSSAASSVDFTPSSANGTSGSITVSGNNLSATTTSIAVSVQASIPSFPTLPGTGLHSVAISVPARWAADTGVTSSGGLISAVADNSGNARPLGASAGVSVGANTGANSLASAAFPSTQTNAANSGLNIYGISTSGWYNDTFSATNWTIYVAFQTGSSLTSTADQFIYFGATNLALHQLYINHTNSHLMWWDKGISGSAVNDLGALSTNTLYVVMVRFDWSTGLNLVEKVWINGTPTTVFNATGGASWAGARSFNFGQAINDGTLTWGSFGASGIRWLESGFIKGALPDANMTGTGSLNAYLTSKWS